MRNRFSKKGFTLIEMLVVIAIVAVLVAIIVPVFSSSTQKAKAATDAANLRTILGILNIEFVKNEEEIMTIAQNSEIPDSSTFPGAEIWIAYCPSYFIQVYYKDSGNYFGIEYFSDVASGVESPRIVTDPTQGNSTVQLEQYTG